MSPEDKETLFQFIDKYGFSEAMVFLPLDFGDSAFLLFRRNFVDAYELLMDHLESQGVNL